MEPKGAWGWSDSFVWFMIFYIFLGRLGGSIYRFFLKNRRGVVGSIWIYFHHFVIFYKDSKKNLGGYW